MGNFRKLRTWQLAKDLAIKIYKCTGKQPFANDFGFRDQIQRSAISIPSNIAEGDESGSNKLSIRYFNIAKGSLAELQTQVIIACEIGYIESDIMESLVNESDKISLMLTKIIKART